MARAKRNAVKVKRSSMKKLGVRGPKAGVMPSWAIPLGSLALGILISAFVGIPASCGMHPKWDIAIPAQLMAAFLIIFAFPARAQVLPEVPEKEAKPTKSKPRGDRKALWDLLRVAGLLLAASLLMKWSLLSLGWAVGIGAVALIFWCQKTYRSTGTLLAPSPFPEWLLLLGVMGAAALARFPYLKSNVTGLQGDEVNNLLDSWGIVYWHFTIADPYLTGWGGTPDLPKIFVALFFQVFGSEVWVGRLVSALSSMIALWIFYKWCRFWISGLSSLIVTFLLAVSWWFLYFSLSPFNNAFLLMTEVMSFYFLEKGFREGKRMDFWWSGISAAACVMNYVPGRGIPGMMFFTILAFLVIKRGPFFKAYWKHLFLTLLAFFWFVSPFLIYGFDMPGEVWGRVLVGWIGQEAHRTGSYLFLLEAFFWTLSNLWFPNSNLDHRFGDTVPFLDPFTGALVLAGIGLCFVHPKKPLAWVLLPGFLVGTAANALGIQASPAVLSTVHSVRLSTIMPFVFLAAGWGLDWMAGLFGRATASKWNWLYAVLGFGLITAPLVNFPILFHDFRYSRGAWGERGFDRIGMADVLKANYPKDHLLVEGACLNSIVNFQIQDKIQLKSFLNDPELPIPYKVHKNVLLVFQRPRLTAQGLEKIKETYPKAVWTDFKSPWDEVYMTTVEIPLADVQTAQEDMELKEELP